jgi:transposase-like protein
MDERLKFVARRLAGEAMAELCREYGISRKTGYKIFDRYQECRGSRTEADVRIATPTNFRSRSKTSS